MRKLMNKKLNKKGFTLMEMLIVVAIIAILVAIAIPTFTKSLNKAKVSADEANLRALYAETVANNLVENTETKLNKTTVEALITSSNTFTVAGVTYTLQYPDATASATVDTNGNMIITYTYGGTSVKIPGGK